MGRMKAWQMEQDERGFKYVADRYVCDECVDDGALRAHIRDNAARTRCDYCDRESGEPIACELDTFLYAFAAGIAVDWQDAINEMPRDGGDWALPEANKDIYDLISEGDLGVELHPALFDDVVQAFNHIAFAPRYFFDVAPDEALRFGWVGFVEHVSHRSRYLFMSVDAPNSEFAHSREIPPNRMLAEIGRVIAELGLVRELHSVELFRARLHDRSAPAPTTAQKLGTPPTDRARRSNRMSPNGIAMFYAGLDEDTAVDETLAVGRLPTEDLSVGVFTAHTPLNVVDLVNLPPIPSVFDPALLDVRPSLIFLHRFVDEVRRPIDRQEHEHIEYVPTQIVTEFFRDIYPAEHGVAVDGLLYRSAVHDGGMCVVLFIENDACFDVDAVLAPGTRALVLQRSHIGSS